MDLEEARGRLGVHESATADEIDKAFRKLAAKAHPDRPGGSDSEMADLLKARDAMLDRFSSSREMVAVESVRDWIIETGRETRKERELGQQVHDARTKLQRRSLNRLRSRRLALAITAGVAGIVSFIGKDAPQAAFGLEEDIRLMERRKVQLADTMSSYKANVAQLTMRSPNVMSLQQSVAKDLDLAVSTLGDQSLIFQDLNGFLKAAKSIAVYADEPKENDSRSPAYKDEFQAFCLGMHRLVQDTKIHRKLGVETPELFSSWQKFTKNYREFARNLLVVHEATIIFSDAKITSTDEAIENLRIRSARISKFWQLTMLTIGAVATAASGILTWRIRRTELKIEDIHDLLTSRARGFTTLVEIFNGSIPTSWTLADLTTALPRWLRQEGNAFSDLLEAIGPIGLAQYMTAAMQKSELIEAFDQPSPSNEGLERYRLHHLRK